MKKNLILAISVFFLLSSCNLNNQNSSSNSIDSTTPTSSSFDTTSSLNNPKLDLPSIILEKTLYNSNETIIATIEGAISTDKIGLFNYDNEPGKNTHIKQFTVKTNTSFEFNVADLKLENGLYSICLYQNKTFTIYDRIDIKINDDFNDYKISHASINYETNGKLNKPTITVVPSSSKTLTYTLYWSKDQKRLEDYTPLKTIQASTEFEVNFKEGLFMPDNANEIEIVSIEGASTPYYLKVNDSLKLQDSNYLFNFQVMSDIHSNTDSFFYWKSHFISAMQDIYTYASNTDGIFMAGDITDMGIGLQYTQLFNVIDSTFIQRPNIYYAMGNHDYMYSMDSVGGYSAALNTFIEETSMQNAYYSVEINGYKFIILSSEEKTTAGSMSDEQFNWFKSELEKEDKNKPTFIIMHQPLRNTVIGSYAGTNSNAEGWFGLDNKASEIKEFLKDYPNAIVFTGHTHYTIESKLSTIYGHGENATFVNDGAIAYLHSEQYTDIAGSQGYFVEVYEDYIVLKGREFVRKKWISYAQYVIPLYK